MLAAFPGEDGGTPAHLDTTDIDIHISLFADAESDVGPLEAALEAIDAEPDPGVDGWRKTSWRASPFPCPAAAGYERRTSVAPASSRDWAEEPIERIVEGETVTYQARFAGLEGYLLARSYAARRRGEEKDYCDLVHVLLYNRAGGPAQAGAQLAGGLSPRSRRAGRA